MPTPPEAGTAGLEGHGDELGRTGLEVKARVASDVHYRDGAKCEAWPRTFSRGHVKESDTAVTPPLSTPSLRQDG